MKTAMLELVEKLVSISNNAFLNGKRSDCDVIDKIKEIVRNKYLQKEKEQIKNAFESGEKNIDFHALHGQGKLSDSNKYYNETFKND